MTGARSSQAGFTLLEVLTVVFIMGLVTSLVVIALPEPEQDLQTEARRLERTIDQLQDRAILTGAVHALDLTASNYQVTRWQAGTWTPLPGFSHEFPGGVVANISGRQEAGSSGWRLLFDPVGLPFQSQINLIGRGERVELNYSAAPDEGR